MIGAEPSADEPGGKDDTGPAVGQLPPLRATDGEAAGLEEKNGH